MLMYLVRFKLIRSVGTATHTGRVIQQHDQLPAPSFMVHGRSEIYCNICGFSNAFRHFGFFLEKIPEDILYLILIKEYN